jgi:hypothetical protein
MLSPEPDDEVAATVGEIMLLLADHGGDQLARGALGDAHRLREAARTPPACNARSSSRQAWRSPRTWPASSYCGGV